jgi:hypothetical protein
LANAAEQGCNFGLDSLRRQRSRAVAQNLGQRIGKSSWLGDLENVSVGHGYHSFGGEVEASSTPTIHRLTPSCRHQIPAIAQLKSSIGLSAEESKLRTAKRPANLLFLCCILSGRVFWMTMLNRSASHAPSDLALTEVEIGLRLP